MEFEVKRHLNESSHLKRYDFVVIEKMNELSINGVVSCYYHKQIAQEIVRNLLLKKAFENITFRNELVVEQIS